MGTAGISKLMRGRRIQEFRDPALSSEKNITQDKKCLSYGFTDHRFSIDLWTISRDKCGLARPAGPNLVFDGLMNKYVTDAREWRDRDTRRKVEIRIEETAHSLINH